MALFKLNEVNKLKKEIERLQVENERLKEAQRRCAECENFDKRRGFAEESDNS